MKFFCLNAESLKRFVVAKIIKATPVNQVRFVNIICFFVGLLAQVDLLLIIHILFVNPICNYQFLGYGMQRPRIGDGLGIQ
jgi:hypothetical protein